MQIAQKDIVVAITATADAVAEFAGDPANLPLWAAGLADGIRREGGEWVFDAQGGAASIRFLGPVSDGILDHDVILPGGVVVHCPMRVTATPSGCDVTFTLIRQPGMTDDSFDADAATIRSDLKRLGDLLERA